MIAAAHTQQEGLTWTQEGQPANSLRNRTRFPRRALRRSRPSQPGRYVSRLGLKPRPPCLQSRATSSPSLTPRQVSFTFTYRLAKQASRLPQQRRAQAGRWTLAQEETLPVPNSLDAPEGHPDLLFLPHFVRSWNNRKTSEYRRAGLFWQFPPCCEASYNEWRTLKTGTADELSSGAEGKDLVAQVLGWPQTLGPTPPPYPPSPPHPASDSLSRRMFLCAQFRKDFSLPLGDGNCTLGLANAKHCFATYPSKLAYTEISKLLLN